MTGVRRRGLDWLLNGYAGLALIYLLVPIAVIIVVVWARIAGTEALLGTEGERG